MTAPEAHIGAHILVTGGAGFIGSHVADALMQKGYRVSVLDNLSTGFITNLERWTNHPRFQFVQADITRDLGDALARLALRFGRIERIAHFAAQTAVPLSIEDPVSDINANLAGTTRILEYARHNNVAKVLFASSAAVFGDEAAVPLSEDTSVRPASPYGINKLTGELYLDYYARLYGLNFTALRFMNVYGPRQDPKGWYSGVISIFMDRALANQPITIFGDGQQTRDFVYIGDTVNAALRALLTDAGNNSVINIGTGVAVSIDTLTQAILELTNSTSTVRYEAARAGDIRHSYTSIEKARVLLDFAPRTDLRAGLNETLTWMRENTGRPRLRSGSAA